MDLSNILKKYQDSKKKAPRPKQQQPESDDFYASGDLSKEKVNLSQIVAKAGKPRAAPLVRQVYEQCLEAVVALYSSVRQASSLRDDQLTQAAQKALQLLREDDPSLISFLVIDYPHENNFLHRHAVNTGFIAGLLADELKLSETGCLEVCAAGFLHDIGLEFYPEILSSSAFLTEGERRQIGEHPLKGHDALNRMDTRLSRQVLEAVYEEHERMDGSGYPRGLTQEAVSEYARIVGVASVYESLTHWRPYRPRCSACDALKALLDHKSKYESRVLKALIERIGIFPPGALVQLNTREVAVVISTNKKAPFKPVVKILFDALGKKMAEPKQIDLCQNSVVYVEESLQGDSEGAKGGAADT